MSKVKVKTRKAIKKRFKPTGSGKLLRSKQGRGHLLAKKTSKRKRGLRQPAVVKAGYLSLYKRLIGAA